MKVIQFTEKEFNLLFEISLKNLQFEQYATKNWFPEIPDNISKERMIELSNSKLNSCIIEMHRRFHYELNVLKNKLME